jgi:uncharacterized Zn finger protein
MSLGLQHFNPRCGICKKARRSYNAIEAIAWDGEVVTVRCRICGHVSRRRSWAARNRAIGVHELKALNAQSTTIIQ